MSCLSPTTKSKGTKEILHLIIPPLWKLWNCILIFFLLDFPFPNLRMIMHGLWPLCMCVCCKSLMNYSCNKFQFQVYHPYKGTTFMPTKFILGKYKYPNNNSVSQKKNHSTNLFHEKLALTTKLWQSKCYLEKKKNPSCFRSVKICMTSKWWES